jgi:hypothetical protein
MQKISRQGEPALFVENVKDLKDFLPQGDTVLSVKFIEGGRKILYKDSGWYIIEESDKTKGIYAGNICTVCEMGEIVDSGGCATCSRCGAQLKCGL